MVTVLVGSLGASQGDLVLWGSGRLRRRLRGSRVLGCVGLTIDAWRGDWIDAGSHESPPVESYRQAVENL